uniref:Uncharacterized protein n=1 Tax=Candidozyma auris TaxID=498019 RepID=A0A0L0P817_CANAR
MVGWSKKIDLDFAVICLISFGVTGNLSLGDLALKAELDLFCPTLNNLSIMPSKSNSTLLALGMRGGDEGAEEELALEVNLRPRSLNFGIAWESFDFADFLALGISELVNDGLEDRLDSS